MHHTSALYPLPGNVSFEDSVLLTTAGTGLYGLDAADGYIAGQDVLIVGPGPIGLMTVQVCKQMGAARIILTGTQESRLAMGREFGADHTINIREQDPGQAILDITNGQGVDIAIECCGASQAPQQCIEVTKRGGKIVLVAFYPGDVTLDLSAMVRNDVNMYATRGEGGNNVKRAVALAAAGRLTGQGLVTHQLPLVRYYRRVPHVARTSG